MSINGFQICYPEYPKNLARANLPEGLILFLNVGKYHTETFIGEFYHKNNKRYSACHYSLFVCNFLSNHAYYCDSAGWSIPRQLTHPFGDLSFAITRRILTPYVLLAHIGNSFQGKHKCLNQSCSALYPLKSRSKICGVPCVPLYLRFDLTHLSYSYNIQ